jgi:cytochrome c biogenesis protein ResB
MLRRPAAPTSASLDRLRADAPLVLPGRAGTGSLDSAEGALSAIGLRSSRFGELIDARSSRSGLIGSAVFHWALALIFVVAGLGQLTRTEGVMEVVAGLQKPNVAESYARLEVAPWSRGLREVSIAVPSVAATLVANGIDQGVTPYVEVRDKNGFVLARGFAYPNHPVRYRSMLIHGVADGLAALVEIEGPGDTQRGAVLLRYNKDRSDVEPGVLDISGSGGGRVGLVRLTPIGIRGQSPQVRVLGAPDAAALESSPTVDAVVGEGGRVPLGDGFVLRVVDLTKYAGLRIADDWSVGPLYLLFILAIVGLVFAILAPSRAVRVLLVESSTGGSLHVAVRHTRGDPNFPDRVESVLRAGLTRSEEDA